MASEILPHLFLGNENDAHNPEIFSKVDTIFNITRDRSFSQHLPEFIETIRLNIDDNGKYESDQSAMVDLFKIGVQQIESRLNSGKTVLVHCWYGMQRGPIMIAAYLIWKHNLTSIQSINYVIQKRPIAFAGGRDINFWEALSRWESMQHEKEK